MVNPREPAPIMHTSLCCGLCSWAGDGWIFGWGGRNSEELFSLVYTRRQVSGVIWVSRKFEVLPQPWICFKFCKHMMLGWLVVRYVVKSWSPDATDIITRNKWIPKQRSCKQSELAESFEVLSQPWICLKWCKETRIDWLVVQYVVKKWSPDATVIFKVGNGILKQWSCEQSELAESFEALSPP